MIRRGFTLIELLTTLAIIAVLAGLLIPVIGMFQRQAARSATQALVKRVMTGVAMYTSDRGTLARQGIAPAAVRPDGTPVTSIGVDDWATVRDIGKTLYREIVSRDPDAKLRPRPGYITEDIRPDEINRDDPAAPYLIDRWGNPLIYLAWNGTMVVSGGSTVPRWPDRPGQSATFANIGYRLPSFDRTAECWSAGPDGAFVGLITADGNDADNISDPDTEVAAQR
ncbi:MAG: hypothetical protein RLZZ127_345 [Planctomycetota bacterium]|jgi:prepilin-type N-terminal cleavage/methylation domain-containing protein